MSSIWHYPIDLEKINALNSDTLMAALDIRYVDMDSSSLTASMPVTSRVHQPLGMLHGGASVALAESVGSMAANLAVDEAHYCLGLDINANHIKAVRSGMVFAKAEPVHLGKQTQVWQIDIRDEQANLVCQSRLTMMVRQKARQSA